MKFHCAIRVLVLLQVALAVVGDFKMKTISCMSYMERESAVLEEIYDDEEIYHDLADLEYGSQNSVKPETLSELRNCQPDHTFCFSLWRQYENGTIHIEKQGCWKDNIGFCSHPECTSTARNTTLHFCCCASSACNGNVRAGQLPEIPFIATSVPNRATPIEKSSYCSMFIVTTFIPAISAYYLGYSSNLQNLDILHNGFRKL